MGMVTLSVNGRRYDVTCGDGEEEHLRHLGASIDRRLRDLVATLGQAGEARLLLLACLLLEDEVAEARSTVRPQANGDVESRAGVSVAALAAMPDKTAADLEVIARRIEAVAGRLKFT